MLVIPNAVRDLLFVGSAKRERGSLTGDDVSYISTGGGAFLEFLEGKELPAVTALKQSAG